MEDDTTRTPDGGWKKTTTNHQSTHQWKKILYGHRTEKGRKRQGIINVRRYYTNTGRRIEKDDTTPDQKG